jgi:hypothetical protein
MQEKVIIFSMTWTNIIAIVGVLITLALGIYNAAVNRSLTIKTKFVDTITSERIEWLEKLRMDLSKFSGLTIFWAKSLRNVDTSESVEVLKEIDILRVMIKLRLNPEGTYDKQIIELLDKIPLLTDKTDLTEINNALDMLTKLSQKLLKEEWNRVKKESKKGREIKA